MTDPVAGRIVEFLDHRLEDSRNVAAGFLREVGPKISETTNSLSTSVVGGESQCEIAELIEVAPEEGSPCHAVRRAIEKLGRFNS